MNKENNKILSSETLANVYKDTVFFDDKKLLKNLFNYKLHKIKWWYGTFVPTLVLNGLQLTYKHLLTGELISTENRFGSHQLIGSKEIELDNNEYLTDFKMHSGYLIDLIEFTTNKGKTICCGGTGGAITYKGLPGNEKKVILGTFGGYGGHLHNFGVYYLDHNEFSFIMKKK